MAFKRYKTLRQRHITFEQFPITNGVTVNPGVAVRLSAGRLGLAVSGQEVTGVSMNRSALTGDVAGTVFCPVELDPSGIYDVPQGALPAGEVQLGDLLNFNATADGLASNTNGDLVVFGADLSQKKVYVQFRLRMFR
jgi:hypothetical protein